MDNLVPITECNGKLNISNTDKIKVENNTIFIDGFEGSIQIYIRSYNMIRMYMNTLKETKIAI